MYIWHYFSHSTKRIELMTQEYRTNIGKSTILIQAYLTNIAT